MKRLVFLAFTFVIVSACFSQRIYFCKNYTTSGDPISTGSTWTIGSGGGNVYVLFQNGGKSLNVNSITYYIDKLSSTGSYTAWENKFPTCDPNKTWHVLDYKFTTTGDYKIRVLVNYVEVATEYVTIKDNGTSTSTSTGSTTPSSKDMYTNSSVTTGTDIDLSSGHVYGLGSSFTMNSQNTARVYFKVSNGSNKLGTTKLIVDFWKMNSSGTYDFYVTKNYDITDLNWIYFSYDFNATGSYKVSVYTATSAYINTAYVTITGKTANTASGNSAGGSPSAGTSSSGDYYTGSSVIAGTDIDLSSGYVYGLGGPFKRNPNKAKVYFKVNNGAKSINTPKLTVDIWKMNTSGTYDFFQTKYFDLSNQSLTWVYFSYEFEVQGSYKVMVYNANSTWINTAYMSVQ